MAHAISFDTLEYTETLMESGVPAKQAKAQANALVKLHQTADWVTRSDLDVLKTNLDAHFTSIDARFTGIDTRLSAITWVLGMVAAGVVTLLIKTFF